MLIRARFLKVGDWVDVPSCGTGRVAKLSCYVGSPVLTITLDNGWVFKVNLADKLNVN